MMESAEVPQRRHSITRTNGSESSFSQKHAQNETNANKNILMQSVPHLDLSRFDQERRKRADVSDGLPENVWGLANDSTYDSIMRELEEPASQNNPGRDYEKDKLASDQTDNAQSQFKSEDNVDEGNVHATFFALSSKPSSSSKIKQGVDQPRKVVADARRNPPGSRFLDRIKRWPAVGQTFPNPSRQLQKPGTWFQRESPSETGDGVMQPSDRFRDVSRTKWVSSSAEGNQRSPAHGKVMFPIPNNVPSPNNEDLWVRKSYLDHDQTFPWPSTYQGVKDAPPNFKDRSINVDKQKFLWDQSVPEGQHKFGPYEEESNNEYPNQMEGQYQPNPNIQTGYQLEPAFLARSQQIRDREDWSDFLSSANDGPNKQPQKYLWKSDGSVHNVGDVSVSNRMTLDHTGSEERWLRAVRSKRATEYDLLPIDRGNQMRGAAPVSSSSSRYEFQNMDSEQPYYLYYPVIYVQGTQPKVHYVPIPAVRFQYYDPDTLSHMQVVDTPSVKDPYVQRAAMGISRQSASQLKTDDGPTYREFQDVAAATIDRTRNNFLDKTVKYSSGSSGVVAEPHLKYPNVHYRDTALKGVKQDEGMDRHSWAGPNEQEVGMESPNGGNYNLGRWQKSVLRRRKRIPALRDQELGSNVGQTFQDYGTFH